MRTVLLAIVMLSVVAGPAGAQAPGPGGERLPPPPAPSAQVVRSSYGLQILAVDAATVIVALPLASVDGAAPVFIGLWSLGAPVVHVAHGNPGRALGSLALHVGLPLAGLLAGEAVADCSSGEEGTMCTLGPALIGAALGMILATGIDASVLAVERHTEQRPGVLGLRAVPAAAVRPDGGFALGLSGRF